MTEQERLTASRSRAVDQLTRTLAAMEPERAPVPVSHVGPYLSVLASPHLLSWPADVLGWAADRVGEQGWRAVLSIQPAEQGSR